MPVRERQVVASGVRGALAFLTTVPVGPGAVTTSDVGRGTVVFPVVGALLGGASALTAWSVSLWMPRMIAALAAVAVGAILTGALHLDGVADTADSYAARSRDRALVIMRDHAVGSYGAVALVLLIGLQAAAIASLLGHPRGLLFLVAAGALSRGAAVGLGTLLPPARVDTGLTRVLNGVTRWQTGAALSLAVLIAVLAIGWVGIAASLMVAGSTAMWGWHCVNRLGGTTGDTLGAATEMTALIVLLLGAGLR